MSPRVSHAILPIRPRRLRRQLLLIGVGAALAAFGLTTAVTAKADPTTIPEAICEVLASDSSDARFQRLYDVLVYEVELTDAEAGDAIVNSVIYRCPQHREALMRFGFANGAIV